MLQSSLHFAILSNPLMIEMYNVASWHCPVVEYIPRNSICVANKKGECETGAVGKGVLDIAICSMQAKVPCMGIWGHEESFVRQICPECSLE